MDFKVGDILTGKVTGITKFGAFVTLAPGKSGLVHISEIANSYVNDVSEHLKDGQEVKVKIIGIDDNGRINLSIKKAVEQPSRPQSFSHQRSDRPASRMATRTAPRPAAPREPVSAEQSFEDKLKQFMQDSDSKISGLKQYSDKRSSRRRSR